jgi:hypothetical protein
MKNEYEQDINKIRSLCHSRDLDSISDLLVQMEKKWEESDEHSYVNLLRAACDKMASCEFRDKERARSLLERYATLALNKADNTQMDVQLHLLVSYLRLENRLVSLKVSDLPRERGLSADLWLGVWNRVEALIEKDWNRPRSWDRPLYDFRGGLRGAGASSTDSKMAANIERGF